MKFKMSTFCRGVCHLRSLDGSVVLDIWRYGFLLEVQEKLFPGSEAPRLPVGRDWVRCDSNGIHLDAIVRYFHISQFMAVLAEVTGKPVENIEIIPA